MQVSNGGNSGGWVFMCSVCSIEFSSIKGINQHVDTIHQLNIKKYPEVSMNISNENVQQAKKHDSKGILYHFFLSVIINVMLSDPKIVDNHIL